MEAAVHAGRSRVGGAVRRVPVTIAAGATVAEVVEAMLTADVGRIPVVETPGSRKVVGIITRSDIVRAHRERIEERSVAKRYLHPERAFARLTRRSDQPPTPA